MEMQLPHLSKKMSAWATAIAALMILAKGRPEMTGTCAVLIAIVTVSYILKQGLIDFVKARKLEKK